MERRISYTEARNDLSDILNHVCLSHEPVLVTRREGNNTVIISEEDWNAIQETLYLMSSPKDWRDISEKVAPEDCSESLPW